MPAPPRPVLLLVGPEELLLRRAAEVHLAGMRAAQPPGEDPLEVVDLRAVDVRERGLPDLRTASLFGGPRAVVVRESQDLPAEAAAQLLAALDGGGLDAAVVLLATGTARIQGLAKRLKADGARIDVAPPKEWDERGWLATVGDEFGRHGRSADREAVAAVLAHAGYDVAAVAEKVAQAVAAAPKGRIGARHVEAVVVGHGSRGSFAVADAMCDRDPARSLVLLRGVLESGDEPVMVLGALAYRMRALVAVAGGLDSATSGVNVGGAQAKRLAAVRRRFGPGELVRCYRVLADADRDLKGGDLPPAFVLERAVAAIATPA